MFKKLLELNTKISGSNVFYNCLFLYLKNVFRYIDVHYTSTFAC